ncbi:hypothetical protein LSTR_LSTR002011 [Laodelphax striatellus]|uniref:Cysteine-rich DPF motif domain-containing protein 1 n=1 Tax=Laodelphax striatellus TaxID=195883 RepID=A0A482XHP8_LAOST|nr:hypothetical protein LSTR_LSTR002011 [Laodelphax striatellus]
MKADEENPGGDFICSVCSLTEHFDYKGKQPPFQKQLVFQYDTYIMKDPFSLPSKHQILVLGGDCIECSKQVCQNSECSIYYNRLYCLQCALKALHTFPKAVQTKLSKLKDK